MKKNLLTLSVMLLYMASAYTQEIPESWTLAFKGGLITSGPGEINIGGYKAKPKLSPMVKVDFDGILIEKLSMGLFLIYSSLLKWINQIK